MKILHIDEQRGWRGGEQQASYLIAGLGARGHACYIAGRPDSAFVKAEHGAELRGRLELPLRGELDVLSAKKIAAFARAHGIEILHAHTGHAHMIACLARGLGDGQKVVVSRRVDFAPSANLFSRYKYSLPDRFIAISEAIRRVLEAFGVSPEKISVVHSGIDARRLEVPERSRAELGLPEEGRLIGNVAALVGHKDHRTLIAAMAVVLERIPDAHLVIAGDGALRPVLEEQSRTLGVCERVHFLGYRADVPAILKALDVFVLSSNEEGLGTSVLDAMACGAPVVATAAGGIPEMVTNEVTGLLVPVAQADALAAAMIRVLSEDALARRIAENARMMVAERFSADAMVEGNLAVYEEVLRTV